MATAPRRSKASRTDKGKTPAPVTTGSPSAKFVGAACIAMMLLFSSGPFLIIYASYRGANLNENAVPIGFFLYSFGIATFFLLAAAVVFNQWPTNTSRTVRKRGIAVGAEPVVSAQPLDMASVAPAQTEDVPVVQVGRML